MSAKEKDQPAPLSVAKNTIWNAVGNVFYLGSQWLLTILVVTLSNNFEYSGALAFAMSIGNMHASIALFKVRTYQMSDLANEFSDSEYAGFRIITLLAGMSFSLVYLAVLSPGNLSIFATLAYLIFKTDESFVEVIHGINQKHGRMDYIGISQIIRGLGTTASFVVGLLASNNLVIAILAMAAAGILNTLCYDLPHARRFGPVKPLIRRSKASSLAKACLLPVVANFLATSIVSIARQRFGIVQGEELLGIYASIATPAVLIQAGATYLYSPLIGTLAGSLQNGGVPAFKRSFFKVLGLLLACMSIIIIGFSIIGGPLFELVYGSNIEPYLWIFPYVLGATTSIAILLYVNDSLLIMRDGITQIIINAFAFGIIVLAADHYITAFDMNGINIAIMSACVPAAIAGITKVLLRK